MINFKPWYWVYLGSVSARAARSQCFSTGYSPMGFSPLIACSGTINGMTSSPNLDQMTPEQLRALAEQAMQLLSQVNSMGQKIHRLETVNEQLTHEITILKQHKFAKRSEQPSPDQGSLLDDLLDTDIAAVEAELKAVNPPPAPAEPRQKPKRAPLPPLFPRIMIRHEPENTQCACGCQLQRIGEDIAREARLHIGRVHSRATCAWKWACRQCETLIQAPVPAPIIDKGLPTAGLLAHVVVTKFADHLPLYRQEKIFGRAGLVIARSTLAQWVGQTGVHRQQPGRGATRGRLMKLFPPAGTTRVTG
jgi:transposase